MTHADRLILALSVMPAVIGMSCAPSLGQLTASAADRWEAATGLRMGQYHAVPPTLVAEAGVFECGGKRSLGCYHGRTNTLTADMSLHPAHLEVIVLHEWGHYLGAGHGSGDDVMRPGVTMANDCLTPNDLELVCSARACTRFEPECDRFGE